LRIRQSPLAFRIKKESDIFEEVDYFRWQRPVLGMANPPKQLLGVSGSTNLLHLLGVQLLFGPGFPTESEIVSRGNMAALTYGFWQSQFAGDRNIIGQTIELGGEGNSLSDTPHSPLPNTQSPHHETV
jgi:hypothetical protein